MRLLFIFVFIFPSLPSKKLGYEPLVMVAVESLHLAWFHYMVRSEKGILILMSFDRIAQFPFSDAFFT